MMLETSMMALKNGNVDAIDDIYNQCEKLVYSICISYMKDKDLATDMVQNTFILVLDKINLYKDESNPYGWITTIARNLCINELKKLKRSNVIDYDSSLVLSDSSSYQDTPLLDVAMEILKPKELEIVLMHIMDDMKLVDIAKILKCNESTIRWRYNNSLNKIRKYLERKNKDE